MIEAFEEDYYYDGDMQDRLERNKKTNSIVTNNYHWSQPE